MEETTREYQRAIRYLCGCIRDGSIAVGDRLPTCLLYTSDAADE